MNAETSRITIEENPCDVCGTERIIVFHAMFPELRVAGPSTEQAAQQLEVRLTSELEAVSAPAHRDPVLIAIADVREFIASVNAQRTD